MAVRLKIETGDIRVAFDLMGADGSLDLGSVVTTPGGATLRFDRITREDASASPRALEFVLSRGTDDVEPLAGWLYERLKGRVPRVRIDRETVAVDPAQLRRALSEHFAAG